jgi:acetyltransferase-like isoleucine patch superfamily enzyme
MARLQRLGGWLHGVAGATRRRRRLAMTRRALTPPPPDRFASYGRKVLIVPPARIESPDCISIDDGVIVHEHAWLCVQRREGLPPPRLVIGARTSINRFAKIVCHGSVSIGRHVVMADGVYISDVRHVPVADAAPALSPPEPVTIEDYVFLGIGSVVKPGVTLGRGSYVGAHSVVETDVPPYAVAVGAPARVVRRRDSSGEWVRASDSSG